MRLVQSGRGLSEGRPVGASGRGVSEALRLRPVTGEANAHLGAALHKAATSTGSRRVPSALDALPQMAGAMWNLAIAASGKAISQEAEKLLRDWSPRNRTGKARISPGLSAISARRICERGGQLRNLSEEASGLDRCLLNLGLAAWKFEDPIPQ